MRKFTSIKTFDLIGKINRNDLMGKYFKIKFVKFLVQLSTKIISFIKKFKQHTTYGVNLWGYNSIISYYFINTERSINTNKYIFNYIKLY